jgi:hypothetical protein
MFSYRKSRRAIAFIVTLASVCGLSVTTEIAGAATGSASAASADSAASAAAAKQARKAERRNLARKPRPSYKDSPASAADAGS